ncbi:hypothetical protein CCR85_14230 [Rhodothalassium salexigens]|nr:hypothetical protein [Rhodothalassium salexigens]
MTAGCFFSLIVQLRYHCCFIRFYIIRIGFSSFIPLFINGFLNGISAVCTRDKIVEQGPHDIDELVFFIIREVKLIQQGPVFLIVRSHLFQQAGF